MNNDYEKAILADKNGTLTEWFVDYLSDSKRGRNTILAEGLAGSGQFSTPLIDYPIRKLKILMGPEKSFRYYEEPGTFNSRIEAIVESLEKGWKPAPLISLE
jgi:hypothetical protein